jgi:hypothetical protein
MKYCVKTKDGEIFPVWHGVTLDEPQSGGATHLVLTTKDKEAGNLLYKFVGPNDRYIMVCDEQGVQVEPPQ